MAELDQKGFQEDPGLGRKAEPGFPLLKRLEVAEKIVGRSLPGFGLEALQLLPAHEQDVLGLLQRPGQQEVPEMFDHFLVRSAEVIAALDEPVDEGEHRLRFFIEDGREAA